jgi:hypothetical protein
VKAQYPRGSEASLSLSLNLLSGKHFQIFTQDGYFYTMALFYFCLCFSSQRVKGVLLKARIADEDRAIEEMVPLVKLDRQKADIPGKIHIRTAHP